MTSNFFFEGLKRARRRHNATTPWTIQFSLLFGKRSFNFFFTNREIRIRTVAQLSCRFFETFAAHLESLEKYLQILTNISYISSGQIWQRDICAVRANKGSLKHHRFTCIHIVSTAIYILWHNIPARAAKTIFQSNIDPNVLDLSIEFVL